MGRGAARASALAVAAALAWPAAPAAGGSPAGPVAVALSAAGARQVHLAAAAWSMRPAGRIRSPSGGWLLLPSGRVRIGQRWVAVRRVPGVRWSGLSLEWAEAAPVSPAQLTATLAGLRRGLGPGAHLAVWAEATAPSGSDPAGLTARILTAVGAGPTWRVCTPRRCLAYAAVPGVPSVAVAGQPVAVEVEVWKASRERLELRVGSPLLPGG